MLLLADIVEDDCRLFMAADLAESAWIVCDGVVKRDDGVVDLDAEAADDSADEDSRCLRRKKSEMESFFVNDDAAAAGFGMKKVALA